MIGLDAVIGACAVVEVGAWLAAALAAAHGAAGAACACYRAWGGDA